MSADATDWTRGDPRLLVSQCRACGARWYLSRDACPSCGDPDVERVQAVGTGMVVAATSVHRASTDAGNGREPLGIVLVDLDEGVRVMGRSTPGVGVGASVRVRFEPTTAGDGVNSIPVFEVTST